MGKKTPLDIEPEGDPITTWYANAAARLVRLHRTTQIPISEIWAYFELYKCPGTIEEFVTCLDKAFDVYEKIAEEEAEKAKAKEKR